MARKWPVGQRAACIPPFTVYAGERGGSRR